MNASWIGDGIKANPDVKMGLAMAVNDGVVVAVVNKADAGDLAAIAVQRRDLTERARTGKLTPADITGATFTISNLGMYHVDQFTAIIVPPQAGILAVGAMTDRVVPMPGALIPIGVQADADAHAVLRSPRRRRRARRGVPARRGRSDS